MWKIMRPIIRRATTADYDAVMDLVRNVDQVDEYLPVMFHSYLNDKRHAIYVAETPHDHKLIHISNCRLPSDAHPTTLTWLGVRTRRNYQGMGVYHAVKQQALRDFPAVNQFIRTFSVAPESLSRVHRPTRTVHFQWLDLGYDITQSCLQTLSPASSVTSSSVSSSSKTIRRLSFSECLELIQNRNAQKFLSSFASGYIPSCHVSWMAMPLDSEQDLIDEMTKISGNTLVTYSNDASTDAKSIVGMSFSYSTPLLAERRHFSMHFNIHYFGTSVDDMTKHVEAQLRYASTLHHDHNILCDVLCPVFFDAATISQQLMASLLPCAKELCAYRGVLVRENVRHLRQQLLRSSSAVV